MRTIWKFPLARGATFPVPVNAIVRHFAEQDGVPTLWVEVNTVHGFCDWTVKVYGTGHELGGPAEQYVGTQHQPPFVWHYYLHRGDR